MAIDCTKANVIVIEDNPDNLFIVTDILKNDIHVQYCNARASGRQLFLLVEKTPAVPIHLVLLDIQLPYEDGYAIIKQIRSHRTLRDTKVIALTANVMPQDVARAQTAGFDGFIGKPIDADRFPEQIRRVLADEAVWEPR